MGVHLRHVAAVAAVTVAFAVSACGSTLTQGTVLAKRDTPAHWTTEWVPRYRTTCGYVTRSVWSTTYKHYMPYRYWTCRKVSVGVMPVPDWVPENWQLEVKDGSQTGWVSVTEPVYAASDIGKTWHAS